MLRAFGHRVVMCCNMLGAVGSNLKMVKFEPTAPNMSQHLHKNCNESSFRAVDQDGMFIL